MTPEKKEELRNHWMARALRAAREAYVSTGGRDIMYLILDAALLSIPLWPDEPYYQRPTPYQTVGAIIDEQGYLRVNVYYEGNEMKRIVRVCEVREMVDNLGLLLNHIGATDEERVQCMLKIRRWITHDDRETYQNMVNDRLPGMEKAKRPARKGILTPR